MPGITWAAGSSSITPLSLHRTRPAASCCLSARCSTRRTRPRTSTWTSTRWSRCRRATSTRTTSGATCARSWARSGRRTARRTSRPTQSSTPTTPSPPTCEPSSYSSSSSSFQQAALSSINHTDAYLFSPPHRNIFQDVMHKDTLVKSFIDEVRIKRRRSPYCASLWFSGEKKKTPQQTLGIAIV